MNLWNGYCYCKNFYKLTLGKKTTSFHFLVIVVGSYGFCEKFKSFMQYMYSNNYYKFKIYSRQF